MYHSLEAAGWKLIARSTTWWYEDYCRQPEPRPGNDCTLTAHNKNPEAICPGFPNSFYNI